MLHTRIPPDSSGTLVRHGPFAGIDRSHEPHRMQSLMFHLARRPLSARQGTWLLGVCCPARSRMTPHNLAERSRSAPTARANACRLGAHAVSRQLIQSELRRRIQSPASFRVPPHHAKQPLHRQQHRDASIRPQQKSNSSAGAAVALFRTPSRVRSLVQLAVSHLDSTFFLCPRASYFATPLQASRSMWRMRVRETPVRTPLQASRPLKTCKPWVRVCSPRMHPECTRNCRDEQ